MKICLSTLEGVIEILQIVLLVGKIIVLSILAQSIGIPSGRVVLLTPPKYDHKAWVAFKAKDGVSEAQVGRSEELCEAYAERCAMVASRRRTQLVDVCRAMKDREVSGLADLHSTDQSTFDSNFLIPTRGVCF